MYWINYWFDMYKACDEGFVMFANHEEYNIMGIGTETFRCLMGF